jgi:F0F1-type ATP synthase assembly protein I
MATNNKSELFYAISTASQLGFMIALPLVGFLLLGLYLDKKLNTLPFFLISLIILSVVFLIIEMRYLLKPFLEKKVGKNDKNNQDK